MLVLELKLCKYFGPKSTNFLLQNLTFIKFPLRFISLGKSFTLFVKCKHSHGHCPYHHHLHPARHYLKILQPKRRRNLRKRRRDWRVRQSLPHVSPPYWVAAKPALDRRDCALQRQLRIENSSTTDDIWSNKSVII